MSEVWLPASDATLCAQRIDGDGDPVPELDRLSPRASARRRATFLAGRLAARRALAQRWGALPPGLRIDPDGSGRPTVSVGGRPSATRVSISHVGTWAIAAAAERPLGVDLVELEPLPAPMLADAFAPGELEAFRHALDAHQDPRLPPCLAFAAKEAALKWLGVGMAVPLVSVCVTPLGALKKQPPPWSTGACIEHPHGRVELPLSAWPLDPRIVCVLLGAETAPQRRSPSDRG